MSFEDFEFASNFSRSMAQMSLLQAFLKQITHLDDAQFARIPPESFYPILIKAGAHLSSILKMVELMQRVDNASVEEIKRVVAGANATYRDLMSTLDFLEYAGAVDQ